MLNTQVDSLESQLDTVNQQLIEANDKALLLSRTVDERTYERDTERHKLLNLEVKVGELQSQRDTEVTRAEDMKSQRDKEATLAAEWKEKAELAERDKAELHHKLLELEQARASESEQHLNRKHELSDVQAELDRSNERNEALERQSRDSNATNQNK
ncbi:hypothetical protein HC752_22440 [Vibrio sp. S9_S30]|uniref:hypothetical protein n=1 Tax=Vibrio sp. S9_S30 TaxID=2720226 RepID=UPI0016811FB7|nr:hypothetical protein [Vibrio sp. S9_S30]MBD1559704.1 hypothetical protein [Vibrio sp. S9_S30]